MKKRLIGLAIVLTVILSSSVIVLAGEVGPDPGPDDPFEPFSMRLVIEYEPVNCEPLVYN